MRLLLIRHADPDYEIDGLTEKGKIEAELLAKKMAGEKIDYIYSSPLGRARLTAMATEDKKGMTAEVCDWLREFSYERCELPYKSDAIAWDIKPAYMDKLEGLYSPTEWRNSEIFKDSKIPEAYDEVCRGLDSLLERHGYVREGYSYRAVKPNHDTIALYCHFGVMAVLVSHLANCSPYSIWQNFVALPSSVTTVHTEEREKGVASMRISAFGDLSHLYAGGEEPSFSARFCECYTDDTRHE